MNDSSAPPPPASPPGYPAEIEHVWRASDGTPIRLRALRPDDLDRELDFIARLSEKTLYLRLQYSSREVSRADAARLLDLDYRDTMAIGALLDEPRDGTLIGVSRYARIDGTDRAECAVVVEDAWQGRGVASELMRSLGAAAWDRGIRTLEGSTLAENQRIHTWARRLGLDVRTEPHSGGLVKVTLDLASMLS